MCFYVSGWMIVTADWIMHAMQASMTAVMATRTRRRTATYAR